MASGSKVTLTAESVETTWGAGISPPPRATPSGSAVKREQVDNLDVCFYFAVMEQCLPFSWQRGTKKLMCMCAQSLNCVPLFVTPSTVACQSPLHPWDRPGKNTGVGCHFFLHGTFPTQGLNPPLLHWQVDSLPPCHLGNPQQNK